MKNRKIELAELRLNGINKYGEAFYSGSDVDYYWNGTAIEQKLNRNTECTFFSMDDLIKYLNYMGEEMNGGECDEND